MPYHFPKAADAEWKKIPQRTFTRWCNERLKPAGIVINNLKTDLCDGIKLIKLLEELAGKNVGKYNQTPKGKPQKIDNTVIALKFIETEGMKLVNIDANDIVKGNLKLILSLISQLILNYQISVPVGDYDFDDDKKGGKKRDSGVTLNKALLAWVNSKMPPNISVANFTTDWNDGQAIAALVYTVVRGLHPDVAPQDLEPNDPVNIAKKAMELAEKYLDIPFILDAADMCNPKVDEMSIMTYVSYFPGVKRGASNRPQLPVAAKCSEDGPSIAPEGLVGSDVEEPLELTMLPDDSLSVSFVPKSPGKHLITVNKDNRHVTGSPFHVMVTAGEPTNRVGQSIDIKLKDIPVGCLPRLEARLQRPESEVEESVTIEENSDDTLLAQFIPQKEGVYELHVRKDKKPLPESPYLINVIGNAVVIEVHPVGQTCDVGLDISGVALPDDFKKLTATLQRPRSNNEEPNNPESNPGNISDPSVSSLIECDQDNSDEVKDNVLVLEKIPSAMKKLPFSKKDMLSEASSLGLLGKDPNLDKPRAKLISYMRDSNKISRSFNHVSILVVGSSGVGKSSTVNHLLNIGAEKGVDFKEKSKLTRINSTTSETRTTSEFLAFADDPDLEVIDLVLGIVDTPGFNDTDGLTQDACNFYSIKKFYTSHPKLGSCFPNLIFVLVPATDTRIAGENSNLSKSLRCINQLSLIDHRRPNVVAVLPFCCSVLSREVEVWEKRMEKRKKVVQDVIFNSLKVNAPVVLLENDFIEAGLKKDGDFTKLPNGELQPRNLYYACQSVLRKNEDNLGLVTFNACFSKLKTTGEDGHNIRAKDARNDPLSKEEEEFVKYFEQAARGENKDFIFDATQQFIQSRNLDDQQEQEAKELASSLKRMGLNQKKDCDYVTLGIVQYYHEEPISEIGKNLLEEMFGIQAKPKTHADLDSDSETDLCRLIGQGFNILHDKSTPCQIMKYKTTTTDFGIVIPSCAKFVKVTDTPSFMDQYESDSEYVKSRLSKLNVGLNVNVDMFNMGARAGFNNKKNASSNSSETEYSFLHEERMFELKMANFKEYIKKGIDFTDDFVSAVDELPESYDKNDPANRSKFERFFNRFGHFIITAAYGGGSIEAKVTSQQHGSDAMSFREMKACLSASFSGGLINASGEVLGSDSLNTEAKFKTMLSQTKTTFKGGRRDLHVEDTITNQDKMLKWKLSVSENPTMLSTEMYLEPISTVISCVDKNKDPASYEALKDLLGGEFKVLASREREREEKNRKIEEEAKRAQEATTRIGTVQQPDPSGDKCFPINTIVYIKDVTGNIKKKQMGDLSIGDKVRACDTKSRRLIYSEVIMFAHRDTGVEQVNYLKIVLEDTSSIVLSSNHLIMSGERMKATMARNIKVDHMLFTINEEAVISSKKVVAIKEINDSGVFCPITKEGNIVVNNILASCYASVNDQAFLHGLFKVSAQNVAHLGLLPMRVLHKFHVKWVSQSGGKDKFVHPYVRWLCKLKLPWMDGELDLPPVS